MTQSRATQPLPWQLADVLALCAFTGIGFVTLFVAWWGVSGTAEISAQVTWINGGVGGLLVLGTGNCIWLLAGRRALGERCGWLLGHLGQLPVGASVQDNGAAPEVVSAPGMAHYHRPDCQLVIGKRATPESAAERRRHGRRPCGMCCP
jgi:hypothetical protein